MHDILKFHEQHRGPGPHMAPMTGTSLADTEKEQQFTTQGSAPPRAENGPHMASTKHLLSDTEKEHWEPRHLQPLFLPLREKSTDIDLIVRTDQGQTEASWDFSFPTLTILDLRYGYLYEFRPSSKRDKDPTIGCLSATSATRGWGRAFSPRRFSH